MPVRKQLTAYDQSIWFQNNGSVALESSEKGFGVVFSDSSWASDVFVFFHNGVRHQLVDLKNMIHCAACQTDGFEEPELLAFEKWLVHFFYLVVVFFEVETKIIYPALLEVRLGLNAAMERQRERQKKVVKHLVEIHAECLLFTMSGRRAGNRNFPVEKYGMQRSVDRMSGLIHGLGVDLDQIFEWEMKELVPVVEKGLMRWEARALVRQCLRDIFACKVGRDVVWGYFQGVPIKIKEEQLANLEPLTRIRLRAKERRWTKMYQYSQRCFNNWTDSPSSKTQRRSTRL